MESPDAIPSPEELEADCTIEFFRSGGPGGQHRNKVETAVRLTHRPTGITVTATERRSQLQNRRAALERLRDILVERAKPVVTRKATRKPRRVRAKQLEEKRKRSEVKQSRSTPRDWD